VREFEKHFKTALPVLAKQSLLFPAESKFDKTCFASEAAVNHLQ
jgi:hypothetical protein